jgi:endogenous inhibitor of DNA gyrase (YacG/DUF329 family)
MPAPSEWRCPICGDTLGTIRRGVLYPLAVVTRIDAWGRFTIACPRCDQERAWVPRFLLRRAG